MHLNVAAALILNEAGEVLCVKRGASKFQSTAFKWEFPGGKIEANETAAQAAIREIKEELGITIEAIADAPCVEHTYPEFSITLQGVLCVQTTQETPQLSEHIEQCWCAPDELWKLDFAAADVPLLCYLREKAFGAALKTNCFGRYPHFLMACESTNDELLRLAERGAPAGTLVVSEVQSSGRGRLGRSWLSEPGQGLLFSFLARPQLPPEIAVTLPLVAGLAVTLALRALGVAAGLKWPNDVLLGDLKVCGVLCEAQTSARGIEGIIIGIGINTGAVPEAVAYRATQVPGVLNRLALLAQILKRFEGLYERWEKQGLAALRAELDQCDCKVNLPITVKLSDTPLEGISRGIREDGALLLETATGEVMPIVCGEIMQWD